MELIDNNDVDTSTYQRTNFKKEEILINHRSVLSSFGINTLDDDADLPSLYWIPKLHKDPYKHRFIAGSAKCSTKPLSKLLTTILTTVKDGLNTVKPFTLILVLIKCGSLKILKNFWTILIQIHLHRLIALKHTIFLPFTLILLILNVNQDWSN